MAISFFPTESVEIHVDDPGYGYVHFRLHREGAEPIVRTLAGHELWKALESLTEIACRDRLDPVAGTVEGLWGMFVGEARALLPAMQQAVLYAAAGTDRAEVIIEDDPHDVLCVNCREGSPWTPPDPCDQAGHTPFAYPGAKWDKALEHQENRNRWAEQRRRLDETLSGK